MKRSKGFTLIELLVVIAIIALLLSIVVPSLKRTKVIAKRTICMSNLKQWGAIYQMYTSANGGKFPLSVNDPSVTPRGQGTWVLAMKDYYQSEDILLCPASIPAPAPKPDYYNNKWQWELGWWSQIPALGENSTVRGSYGENWWITCSPSEVPTVYPDKNKYKRVSEIRNPSGLPVLGDCGTFLARPTENSEPPASDGDYAYVGGDEMRRLCTNRHDTGRVNWVFADYSARQIPLKQLWEVRWHKNWQPRVPNWPEWMIGLPE